MGLVDERYYDEKIENIFSSYNNIDRNEAFLNCKHKAYAASYHLKTILQEFNIVFEQYKNGERSTGAGVNYEHENHILIYETESFLFQIKSNLDLIITFLKDYIPCLKSFRSFKHSGDEAGKIAGGSILKELDNKGLKEWHDLFEKERINWIQNLVVLRDQITHYSKLKNFVNFIEDPNTENEYTVVYFPK
ncbi:MAG: hypothetical protein NTX91_01840, partial [candidate division SR1 bacterium]|nr:hypothetical protein [candidate division SR1 bacterium]